MRNTLTIILLIFCLQIFSQTQSNSVIKIKIEDYKEYDLKGLGRTYELIPENGYWNIFELNIYTGWELLEKLKKSDTVRYKKIMSLNPDSLQKFKKSIECLKNDYPKCPTEIGIVTNSKIDSLLFELNRIPDKYIFNELRINDEDQQRLSKEYLQLYVNSKKNKLKIIQKELCLNYLQNKDTIQEASKSLIKKFAFGDNSYVDIKIFQEKDTLEYKTEGTDYYMLPWFNTDKQIRTYNPKASILVSSIIPRNINGKLLRGEDFMKNVYFYVIEEYCLNRHNKLKNK